MAENSVFSNETGQVMFGTGGQVYRVPYEFGQAFGNNTNTSLTNYIRQDIAVDTDFTFLLWVSRSALSPDGAIQIAFRITFSDGDYLNMQFRPDSPIFSSNLFLNTSLVLGSVNFAQSNTAASKGLFCLRYERATGVVSMLSGSVFVSVAIPSSKSIAFINIPQGVLGRSVAYGDSMLFNRQLSLSEALFIRSNFNGSQPQSQQGMVSRLRNQRAEIIGSDIAINNEVPQSPVGKIMNLPAGSIIDKLAYANTNLFVPFIQ